MTSHLPVDAPQRCLTLPRLFYEISSLTGSSLETTPRYDFPSLSLYLLTTYDSPISACDTLWIEMGRSMHDKAPAGYRGHAGAREMRDESSTCFLSKNVRGLPRPFKHQWNKALEKLRFDILTTRCFVLLRYYIQPRAPPSISARNKVLSSS